VFKSGLYQLKILRHGYTFRKEGHTKVVEYDLSSKNKKEHQAIGLVRPNVLSRSTDQTANGRNGANGRASANLDAELESEEEPPGESTFSDHEMDIDEPTEVAEAQLPKSASGKVKTSRGRAERVMPPEECRAHLRRLFANEKITCSLIFGRHGPFALLSQAGYSWASADMFFMDVIPVSPTRFRPPAKLGETLFEHPQNELLAKVLNTSYRLRDLNIEIDAASAKGSDSTPEARNKLIGTFLETLVTLQHDVNSFVDSSKNPAPVRQGKLPPTGVKQLLEKKEGLFRKHMMVAPSLS
jgi:DNA-directed RNA polymerase beta' subunit